MKTIKCDICGKLFDDDLYDFDMFAHRKVLRFKASYITSHKIDKEFREFDICEDCYKELRRLRHKQEEKGIRND